MTTGTGPSRLTSALDGVSTSFNAPQCLSSGDLLVYVHAFASFDFDNPGTLLAEGLGYSVSGDLAAGTAAIVTTIALPASSGYITRLRDSTRAQDAAYTPNDGFPAKSHEDQLDRLSLVDAEQDERLADTRGRALMLPAGEAAPAVASFSGVGSSLLQYAGGVISPLVLLAFAGGFLGVSPVGNLLALSGTGNDAAFRYDMANPAVGPQLMGYLLGTAEDEFDRGRAQPQAQAMWAAIRADSRDVRILGGIGDSTSNETGELFYQMAVQVGLLAPTHTVIYRLIDYDNNVWGAPVTIQTGTGGAGHTIYWDNYSISGKNLFSIEGSREATIFGQGYSYDLIIFNHGANHGVLSTEVILTPVFKMVVANVMRLNPSAGIFVTLQAPDIVYPSFTKQHVAAWRRVATRLGLGVIDLYHLAWVLADYSDGPHIKASAQQAKAVPEAMRSIAELADTGWSRHGTQPPGPMMVPRQSRVRNSTFWDWPAGQAAPTGWDLSNCTVAKDPGRKMPGFKYSLKVTPTGPNPKITRSVSDLASSMHSEKVSIAAFVWVQTGMDSSGLAGRIDLTCGNGTATLSGTSVNRDPSYSRDGWVVQHAELEFQNNSSSGTQTIYAGKADGSDTLPFWLQYCGLADGDMPFRVDPSDHYGATIEQYFAPGNVHLPNGVAGTLTTAAAGFTLTGATAGLAKTLVEMTGLEVGHHYKITWNMASHNGGAGGALYVTASSNGGGGNVAVSSPLADGAGSLEFVANKSAQSVLVWTNSSGTGYVFDSWSITDTYTGISVPIALPLTGARNPNGTSVDATGGAGLFSLSSTLGSAVKLLSEIANSAAKTFDVVWEVDLPANYIAGKDLTLTVNAKLTGGGTASVKTLKAVVYEVASDGSMGGSDLGSAAQTLTATAADYAFTIAGAGLSPGDRVVIELHGALTETGGVNLQQQYNSARLA